MRAYLDIRALKFHVAAVEDTKILYLFVIHIYVLTILVSNVVAVQGGLCLQKLFFCLSLVFGEKPALLYQQNAFHVRLCASFVLCGIVERFFTLFRTKSLEKS